MADAEKLEPPMGAPVEDPGAHELAEESESDDQFTDAASGSGSPKISSPIPKTRVEKVDDEPSHGEVPGTEAYEMRGQDAMPDEIALAPEATASQDAPPKPELKPPTITVEESPGGRNRSYSIQYEQMRKADASPDILLDSDGQIKEIQGEPANVKKAETPAPVAVQPQLQSTLPFPIPDFDELDPDAVIATLEPYLAALFPPEELDLPTFPPPSKDSVFFTPRSASLWSQLVAPPPLAPPDWIRSRTRRLFLVSLGVPVDLDEILPASKQKKLVLPSLNVSTLSPRTSTDSRSVSRLRQSEANNSSTSVDTQDKASGSSRKRRGPPPQPELDLVAARHLCQTTDEALDGMTDEELKVHIAKLEGLEEAAKEALEYWKKRTDEKIGDREAFEGVIENLVKHARKVRK
ncbi:hypothetical protein HG530_003488 [Fusarium avenaceum]|nr:hypothetical protein HG530_003488 [Fusarium avenaceum]